MNTNRKFVSGLFDRIGWFFSVKKIRDAKMDEYTRKSLESELEVVKMVKNYPFVKDAFHAIRIPDPNRKYGAGEIDVLALTERGYVLIECKNYSGKVISNNDDIIQEKLLKQGQSAHIIKKLRKKEKHLKRCAISTLQDDAFETAILTVFTHSDVELTQDVQRFNCVATLENLEEKLCNSMSDRPILSKEDLAKYAELAKLFGTWDEIEFSGGKRNIGDINDDNLPKKWTRSMIKMIKVRIVGGLFSTIIRGPRIELLAYKRDGTSVKEIVKPVYKIKHKTPWKTKDGIDAMKSLPIEYLQTVRFGHNSQPLEFLSEVVSNNRSETQPKRYQRPRSMKLNSQFYVGKEYKGTVKKYLRNGKGVIYALIISLVERGKVGRLKCKEMNDISYQWIETIFAVGNPINVKVKSVSKEGKIELEFVKE